MRAKLIAVVGAIGVLGAPIGGGAAGASGSYPVQTDVVSAFAAGLYSPQTSPPGANVSGCQLTSTHPLPVVLVHGTFENQDDNWQAMAPTLANAGYCVFTFNYGGASTTNNIQGTGEIGASAQQLSTFVNQVLGQTHAKKVDIVGHSQGGMMPRYYIDFLGGAKKVDQLVGLAPSNHGTTFNGLISLAGFVGVNATSCEACLEQADGSAFLTKLNGNGDTVAGPKYTVIETKDDEVVTPYTSAFLTGPNVTNITIQNLCPNDSVGHVGVPYDTTVLQLTLNALDPAQAQTPTCTSGFGL